MKYATLLQKAHIRPTKIRLAILRNLDSHHALTADQLAALCKKDTDSADRVTVYRNLKALLKNHIVCQLHAGFGPVKFELANHKHQHAVCNSCHRLLTIENKESQDMPSMNNFYPTHTHTTYFGVCGDCK